jgi:hypothetical protein
MSQPITFLKALKGGFITGMIAAGLNNLWSLIAQALGSVPPPGFPVAVTMSSIFPIIIGAILYFTLLKFTSKGYLIFIVISAIFTIVSLYPTITLTEMPDGSPVGAGFTLLTLPMHLISGGLAIWGIPRFSK